MKPFPVSKFISYINECVNSPDNNNQVSILYGLEMTKKLYCVWLFLLSERKHKPIDFSSSDRKLHNKPVREDFKSLNVTGSRNGYGHCFKNS